jgi:hypothetical protein
VVETVELTVARVIVPFLCLMLLVVNPDAATVQQDARRFAFDRAHTLAYWQLAESHTAWLRANAWQFASHPCLYEAWCREAEFCRRAWFLADDAHFAGYSIERRREALEQLRHHLGDWDYLHGHMPPPVPVRRFHEGERE